MTTKRWAIVFLVAMIMLGAQSTKPGIPDDLMAMSTKSLRVLAADQRLKIAGLEAEVVRWKDLLEKCKKGDLKHGQMQVRQDAILGAQKFIEIDILDSQKSGDMFTTDASVSVSIRIRNVSGRPIRISGCLDVPNGHKLLKNEPVQIWTTIETGRYSLHTIIVDVPRSVAASDLVFDADVSTSETTQTK